MSEILVRIRSAVPALSPAEQRVAAAVLGDPAAAAALSIQALAAGAATSTATVQRFCRAVGADGYPQLRLALAGAVAREDALDPGRAGGDIDAADSLDEVIVKIVHNEVRALQETARQLDRAALGAAVAAVAGARRIDVVGVGASGLVAQDLAQKLHRIGRIAFAWSDAHAALTAAALLGPGDAVVGISHSGATADVVEPLALAGTRGAATIALTNHAGSALARAAGTVLTTAAREIPLRSAATASRIAQLAVVDCLFVGVAQHSFDAAGQALRGTYAAVNGRPNAWSTERYRGRDRDKAQMITLGSAGPADVAGLATEARNPATADLDDLSTLGLLAVMNDEDARVAPAVRAALPRIAEAVEAITASLRRGGRLVYLGAGTSGRIGLLDAVECLPTFDAGPDQVDALLAGGPGAFAVAVEGVEDSAEAGAADVDAAGLGPDDTLVGLAASGRTPYVVGGLSRARARGATTVAVACNRSAEISAHADVAIEVDTGPEVLTGSTRLKAGTAQKLVCNMLSTAAMVRIGKTYGNLMIDMRPTNAKLADRAERIVAAAAEVDRETAAAALAAAGGRSKVATVMLLAGTDAAGAEALLAAAGGRVRPTVAR